MTQTKKMNNSYGIFASVYDLLTENVEYEKRAKYIDNIIKKFGGKENGILLDLACGTGTLSEIFSGLGYDVIGIDNSPDMLSIAMNKKYQSEKNIQYVCQDMREIDLYGNVDITICALDSLNHLKNFADVKKVFERVYKFTEIAGLFIFDMNTIYKHQKILADNTFVYDTDDVYCVWQNSCEGDTVSIYLDFFMPQDDGSYERYSEDFTETAYPIEQVKQALLETGFEILGIYGDDSFDDVTDTTQRAVFAVRKNKEK